MVLISLYNLARGKDGTVLCTKDNDIRIEVSGHSGISIKGNDIVCAGISAIIETTVLAITKVAKIKQKLNQKSGYLETRVAFADLDRNKLNDFLIIINTMLTGLEEIRKTYPEALKINFINN